MSISATTCCVFLLAGLLSTAGLAQHADFSPPSPFAELDAVAGKALFERIWVTAPASTASADGLGPHYNARSCAACHPGGGGGSAPAQLNFVINDTVYGELLQSRSVPGLPAEARVTLREVLIAEVELGEGHLVHLRKPMVSVDALQHGELQSAVSIRRAPSLRGLAQLERITPVQLQALADPDDRNGDGISGRLPLVTGAAGTVQPGRFGWKANVATLEEQVSRALSLDIGLGTPLFPSAAGDCSAAQPLCVQAAGPAVDEPEVSQQIVQLLLSYLAGLPPPAPITGTDGATTENVITEDEAASFSMLGCAQCHVPQLAGPDGPLHAFTDLLLHDMGPGLADAVHADHADAAEWRTAALWGLAATERYLHDGRAATLEEAILWHGGEAQASIAAFRALNSGERERLLAWLRTL